MYNKQYKGGILVFSMDGSLREQAKDLVENGLILGLGPRQGITSENNLKNCGRLAAAPSLDQYVSGLCFSFESIPWITGSYEFGSIPKGIHAERSVVERKDSGVEFYGALFKHANVPIGSKHESRMIKMKTYLGHGVNFVTLTLERKVTNSNSVGERFISDLERDSMNLALGAKAAQESGIVPVLELLVHPSGKHGMSRWYDKASEVMSVVSRMIREYEVHPESCLLALALILQRELVLLELFMIL